MPQIQIRDPFGAPIPLMNIRISEGAKPSEAAIFDVFTDHSGNAGWPIPFWPSQSYALHVNYANVNPRYVPQSYYLLPSDVGDVRITLAEFMAPIDLVALRTRPRAGMSMATLIHNPKHNLPEIVRIFNGCGVKWTRINLCSASWTNPTSYMPFTQRSDGRWDLFDWDARYWDRLAEVVDRMNAANIVAQYTFLDLRNFSHREDSDVDQTLTPWRHNVNGIHWEPADTILYRLPDEWCEAFIAKAAPLLRLNANYFEPVNEGPEKDLHIRIMQMVRKYVPGALVCTNRNEDTPTQYKNMKVGQAGSFDLISFHGKDLKSLADLNRVHTYRADDGTRKPLSIPTFEAFLDSDIDHARVCFSSDGARVSDDPVNAYDYDKLREFARYVLKRGCNFEHQSRTKMGSAPNHHMLEAEWFESVVR